MIKVFGYARISTDKQSIDRQVRNIKSHFPNAIIFQEEFTGTKIDRPVFHRLLNTVHSGDTIVFDSVSRMSRNAKDGCELYFNLYDRKINLVFIKEPYINTAIYTESTKQSIQTTGNVIADIYISATNKVIKLLAEKQIATAFEQSEKEVEDLRQRTKEGIETARMSGKQIGQKDGRELNVQKSEPIKKAILRYSKDFNGLNTDKEVIAIINSMEYDHKTTKKNGDIKIKTVPLHVSRNTYYKYKKSLKSE